MSPGQSLLRDGTWGQEPGRAFSQATGTVLVTALELLMRRHGRTCVLGTSMVPGQVEPHEAPRGLSTAKSWLWGFG